MGFFRDFDLEIHAQTTNPAVPPAVGALRSSPTGCCWAGGAVVEDTASEGTLSTATGPFSSTEWDAKAKDHEIASPGRLRVFCGSDLPAAQRQADFAGLRRRLRAPRDRARLYAERSPATF